MNIIGQAAAEHVVEEVILCEPNIQKVVSAFNRAPNHVKPMILRDLSIHLAHDPSALSFMMGQCDDDQALSIPDQRL